MSVEREILEFVRIPSARSNTVAEGLFESALTKKVLELTQREFPNWRVEADEFAPGRFNMLVADGTDSPSVLFAAHLDTVEVGAGWTMNPTGEIRDGKLYGRGSADMKSGIVAVIEALRYARDQGLQGIAALFYGDEEYDFLGMKRFVEKYRGRLNPKLVVCPEPTHGKLQRGCRGVLEFQFDVVGRSGHAARPESGINAFTAFCSGLAAVEQFVRQTAPDEYLGDATVNVTGVQCGVRSAEASVSEPLLIAGNVIPDFCSGVIEIRSIPGVVRAAIESEFTKGVAGAGGVVESARCIHDLPSYVTARGSLALLEEAIRASGGEPAYGDARRFGYSDIAMLANGWEVPALNWGPSGSGAHGPDEYVDINSVKMLVRQFCRVVDVICQHQVSSR